MKKYKVVEYRFGIFGNISLEQFINQTLQQEPDYDLFQASSYEYYIFGTGIVNVRYLILVSKNTFKWGTQKLSNMEM